MIYLITQQWWHQEHLLFGHSLIRIMVPLCHVQMGSARVRALVWTISGMRHWKRLIEIPGGTDCYYCINNMTCLLHVYYCFVVLVPLPDTLSTIMLHVYTVTLPSTCYTFCYSTLLCISCIVLFHIFFVQTPCLYIHNTITRLFMFPTDTSGYYY